ncbi:hypothetical protein M8J76_000538 [Diaphorina citri]|nr:hypothetical protein M8J76_000538 [Diaphorina citri]
MDDSKPTPEQENDLYHGYVQASVSPYTNSYQLMVEVTSLFLLSERNQLPYHPVSIKFEEIEVDEECKHEVEVGKEREEEEEEGDEEKEEEEVGKKEEE